MKALEGISTSPAWPKLEKAIAADPNFGPNYRQLAQIKAQQNDVAGALALLDRALARGSAIPDAERALIELQAATLRDAGRAPAGAHRSGQGRPLRPAGVARSGRVAIAVHQYPQAVAAYRKVLATQPDDADSWNQLAYAAAYAGDLAVATGAAKHYQKLAPANPNPLDTLATSIRLPATWRKPKTITARAPKRVPSSWPDWIC